MLKFTGKRKNENWKQRQIWKGTVIYWTIKTILEIIPAWRNELVILLSIMLWNTTLNLLHCLIFCVCTRELGIITLTKCEDEQNEMLKLATTMFDTKLPPGVMMLQPFSEDSSIKRISVEVCTVFSRAIHASFLMLIACWDYCVYWNIKSL